MNIGLDEKKDNIRDELTQGFAQVGLIQLGLGYQVMVLAAGTDDGDNAVSSKMPKSR